jgi:hypothetical protein
MTNIPGLISVILTVDITKIIRPLLALELDDPIDKLQDLLLLQIPNANELSTYGDWLLSFNYDGSLEPSAMQTWLDGVLAQVREHTGTCMLMARDELAEIAAEEDELG